MSVQICQHLMRERPTWRTEIRQTLRLAGPVVAAQLAQRSMGFVDTVMVGELGPEALACPLPATLVTFVGVGLIAAAIAPTVRFHRRAYVFSTEARPAAREAIAGEDLNS